MRVHESDDMGHGKGRYGGQLRAGQLWFRCDHAGDVIDAIMPLEDVVLVGGEISAVDVWRLLYDHSIDMGRYSIDVDWFFTEFYLAEDVP